MSRNLGKAGGIRVVFYDKKGYNVENDENGSFACETLPEGEAI